MTDTNATTQRNAALRLLRNGDATVAEVANLLGYSRQRVQFWADQESLDVARMRAENVERAWRKALAGPGPKRKR